MKLTIEKAKLDDIDEVALLYDDICDYLATKEYNPGFRKGCYPTRSEALYFYNADGLYVAKMNGIMVGSIALTHNANAEVAEELKYIEEEQDDILYVHEFIVHPDYLRQGIGTNILSFADEVAKQEGVKCLRLYVYEKNSVAIKAYERNGYVFIEKVDIGLSDLGLEWFCLYEKVIA